MFYFLRSLKFLITKINSYLLIFLGYAIQKLGINRKKSNGDIFYFKNKFKNFLYQKNKNFKNCLIIDSEINKNSNFIIEEENIKIKFICFQKNKIYKYPKKNNAVITYSEKELIKELNKLDINKFNTIIINNTLEKFYDEEVYNFLKFLLDKLNSEVKIFINLSFTNKLYPKPFAQRYMPPRVWNISMHKSFYYTNTLLLEDYLNIMEDIGFKYNIKKREFLKNESNSMKKNINPIYFCYSDSEILLSKCTIEGGLR